MEKSAALAFAAIAIACGVVGVRWEIESDPTQLERVDASFRFASVQHDAAGDKVLVKATYRVNGRVIEHVVPEEFASSVGATVPGHAMILVDPKDPLHPPRIAPVALAGAPLLASAISAVLAIAFSVGAWRRRRDEQTSTDA